MINTIGECSGRYKIEAVKPDGSRRVLAEWFPNLILDAGLNRMGNNSDYLNWCQVGTGSTAPAITQVSLAAYLASTDGKISDTPSNSGSEPYYAMRTKTFRFAAGVATGVLAEVGVGWASTGSLYSRALILDALGTPTTITVLADEALDVTYELRMYVWAETGEGTITLAEVEHDVVLKAALAGDWSLQGAQLNAANTPLVAGFTGDVSASITGSPSGTSLGGFGGAGISPVAYTENSLERRFNINAGLSQWNNASGIGAIAIIAGWGTWQIGFTPNIMKTADDVLTLQIKHSWGRAT